MRRLFVQTADHLAEAVSESADLALAIDLDWTVHVTGDNCLCTGLARRHRSSLIQPATGLPRDRSSVSTGLARESVAPLTILSARRIAIGSGHEHQHRHVGMLAVPHGAGPPAVASDRQIQYSRRPHPADDAAQLLQVCRFVFYDSTPIQHSLDEPSIKSHVGILLRSAGITAADAETGTRAGRKLG